MKARLQLIHSAAETALIEKSLEKASHALQLAD